MHTLHPGIQAVDFRKLSIHANAALRTVMRGFNANAKNFIVFIEANELIETDGNQKFLDINDAPVADTRLYSTGEACSLFGQVSLNGLAAISHDPRINVIHFHSHAQRHIKPGPK